MHSTAFRAIALLALVAPVGVARADSIIGYALIDRPSDDAGPGNLHVLVTPFAEEGPLQLWSLYDGEDMTPDRMITPVVVELDGNGDVSIVGVGTPRVTREEGIQEEFFDLLLGDRSMTPERRFGWYDGTNAQAGAGAIDYGPVGQGEPGTAIIASVAPVDIAPGSNLGPPTIVPRTYSVAAVIEPPQAQCDPPPDPADDDQSMHLVSETPSWTHAQFGTWTDGEGEEHPFEVRYHVPANPVALVYAFHGGGGSIGFAETLDPVDVLNLLVEHGFAFVATESTDRVAKTWDWWPETESHDNADYDRLIALRDELIANTAITPATPLFGYGFSSGSKYAMTFGRMCTQNGLDYRAVAANSTHPTPAWIQLVANELDVAVSLVVNGNETKRIGLLERLRDNLVDRHVPVELHIAAEKAISPDRFGRIPAVAGEGLAQDIFDFLVAGVPDPPEGDPIPGVIDADGVRTVTCNEQLASLNALLPPLAKTFGLSGGTTTNIDRQVKITWALHQPTSEYRDAHVAFFLHALNPADLDGDGAVGFGDLLLLLAVWGPCAEQPCWADIDRDGVVSFSDLLVVLGSWS